MARAFSFTRANQPPTA
ncbi:hypothetical protein LINPERPRIM_LOCUS40283 [Linum perenne]